MVKSNENNTVGIIQISPMILMVIVISSMLLFPKNNSELPEKEENDKELSIDSAVSSHSTISRPIPKTQKLLKKQESNPKLSINKELNSAESNPIQILPGKQPLITQAEKQNTPELRSHKKIDTSSQETDLLDVFPLVKHQKEIPQKKIQKEITEAKTSDTGKVIDKPKDPIVGKWSWAFRHEYYLFHEDGTISSNNKNVKGNWHMTDDNEYHIEYLNYRKQRNVRMGTVNGNTLTIRLPGTSRTWKRRRLK